MFRYMEEIKMVWKVKTKSLMKMCWRKGKVYQKFVQNLIEETLMRFSGHYVMCGWNT